MDNESIDNWNAINMLRYKNLMEKLDPEIKSKTIQVQTQMHYFDYYFSVYILQFL